MSLLEEKSFDHDLRHSSLSKRTTRKSVPSHAESESHPPAHEGGLKHTKMAHGKENREKEMGREEEVFHVQHETRAHSQLKRQEELMEKTVNIWKEQVQLAKEERAAKEAEANKPEEQVSDSSSEDEADSPPAPPRGVFSLLSRAYTRWVSIWNGEDHAVAHRVRGVARWLKKNKLDIPAMALAILLILWLSLCFIAFMSFPTGPSINRALTTLGPSALDTVPRHKEVVGVPHTATDVMGVEMKGPPTFSTPVCPPDSAISEPEHVTEQTHTHKHAEVHHKHGHHGSHQQGGHGNTHQKTNHRSNHGSPHPH